MNKLDLYFAVSNSSTLKNLMTQLKLWLVGLISVELFLSNIFVFLLGCLIAIQHVGATSSNIVNPTCCTRLATMLHDIGCCPSNIAFNIMQHFFCSLHVQQCCIRLAMVFNIVRCLHAHQGDAAAIGIHGDNLFFASALHIAMSGTGKLQNGKQVKF